VLASGQTLETFHLTSCTHVSLVFLVVGIDVDNCIISCSRYSEWQLFLAVAVEGSAVDFC